MERRRGTCGQAAAEYVAVVALVAVALTLAAGLSSGGVGGQVLAGLQRGLCHVAAAPCPRPEPRRPDLDPCPVERTVRGERLSATIAVVRVGASGTLSVVRGSDGRITVTLTHGDDAGGELGAGARLRVGRRALGGTVTAGARLTWASGRAWSFASEAAARRFVQAYGRKATIGGRLLDGVRSRCSWLCDAIGWRPHAPLPAPDAVYAEAGLGGALTASLGLGRVALGAGGLLGRQQRRDGGSTWYVKLDAEATAGLVLPGAELVAVAGAEAVLAYELDPHGDPRALRVSLAAETTGASAGGLAAGAARAGITAGGGAVIELDATLDLREPANRTAAAALLAALSSPRAVMAVPVHARALGERIARHGQIDRRAYAIQRTASGLGAGIGLGVKLDGALDRTTSGLRLLAAETRLPGLPFLPRDDCRAA
jgi:hypothetical protein